jgi:uncharacterized protein
MKTSTILLMATLLAGFALGQTRTPSLRLSMISLGVTDMARSMKFYGETLGLPLLSETEPGEVAIFRAGEMTITLNRPLAFASKQIVGAVEVVFNVDSVDATYRTLVAQGCRFIRTPREAFSGTWAATLTDPDGHRITILGPK